MATRDGLTRLKDGHVRQIRACPTRKAASESTMRWKAADGQIWLALPSGLGELGGDRFQTVIESGPVMLDSSFVTLEKGEDGSIWAGTIRKGLWSCERCGQPGFTPLPMVWAVTRSGPSIGIAPAHSGSEPSEEVQRLDAAVSS